MSFLKFDEDNASIGFELVAEGKYEAVVVNVEPGKAQAGIIHLPFTTSNQSCQRRRSALCF